MRMILIQAQMRMILISRRSEHSLTKSAPAPAGAPSGKARVEILVWFSCYKWLYHMQNYSLDFAQSNVYNYLYQRGRDIMRKQHIQSVENLILKLPIKSLYNISFKRKRNY